MGRRGYSIRELLQAEACTYCNLCADVCPAVAATRDGHLSGVYRLDELRRINRSRTGILKRLLGRPGPTAGQLKEFGDTVYRCTLCGRCQEVCPAGILLKDIWLSVREDMVFSRACPERVETIRENLSKSHNVFAEDDDERAGWVEGVREAPEHGHVKEHAEVVYFTGCVSAYFPMAQQIPVALAEILEACEVDFTLLGSEEWCCGFPFLGAGFRDRIQEYVDHNLAAVRSRRAQRVVFACPTCYQMWREHYPPQVAIDHVTGFLGELIAAGRVPWKELPLTVTYHDPCDLGRGAGEYETPREIIRSIPGVKLVELARNRQRCTCCGGGGNLELIDGKLSGEIARDKIEEVVATGASAVVTACQQCVRTMGAYVRRNKIPLEVLDVVQLTRRALKE